MPRTWFTSDTHFSHRYLVLLRGYAPGAVSREDVTPEHVAAHDEAIIQSWNRVVAPEDTVWHLGDLANCPPRRVAHLVQRLHGHKRLVLGNHDQAHPAFGAKSFAAFRDTLTAGFEWAGPFATVKVPIPKHAAPSVPPAPVRAVLSHFPYLGDHTDTPREMQWRLRDEGAVLIHGHTHARERMSSSREVHVGWDAWGRPVELNEIAGLLFPAPA